MNLRKFISGVSALAIAASAFAGMAVTASAATDTLANGDKLTYSANGLNGDYTDSISVTKSAAGIQAATASGDRTGNYRFSSAPSAAIVNLSFDFVMRRSGGGQTYLDAVDNSGTVLFRLEPAWYTQGEDNVFLENGSGTKLVSTAIAKVDVWTHLDAKINFLTDKATIVFNNDTENGSYTIDVPEGVSGVAGYNFFFKKGYFGTALISQDNSYSTEAVAAETVAINYQTTDGTKTIGSVPATTISNYNVGGTYTYGIPKYVVSSDNTKLYKSNVTEGNDNNSYGNQTGSLTAVNSVINNRTYVDVSESAYDSYYFEDFNDTSSGNHMTRMSMGMIASGNKTFTVPEDGIYVIEVRGTSNRADGSNRAAVVRGSIAGILEYSGGSKYVNDNYGEYYAFSSYGDNVTYAATELKRDEILTLSGNGTFDYILLKKMAATATLDSVTNVQPFKMGSDGEENAVTAAILNITVANQSTAIDVTYNNDTQTSDTKFVGSVRLGVIVPGIVENLGTSSFTVTAHVE